MRIQFLGAAQVVTGSCYYIETEGYRFLIDCGMFQGTEEEEKLNHDPFPFTPATIDFVILTHAHIDHSGRLPLLVKNGFSGQIFCTRPTAGLSELLLTDSGHIHMEEAEWENRKRERAGLEKVEPLYTVDDAIHTIPYFYPVTYDLTHQVNDTIAFRFQDAGHLLGSAIVELWVEEKGIKKKLVFSGDLGTGGNPMLNPPSYVEDTDVLFVESTYGNRLHARMDTRIHQLAEAIESTIAKGGTVIIPSFAVGRTQEVIFELKEHYRETGQIETFLRIPFYIDSPLAINATSVYRTLSDYLNPKLRDLYRQGVDPLTFSNIHYLSNIKDSIMLNKSTEPKVIISASGMCDAGRIKHHLKHQLWKTDTSIIFIGYQGEGTLGRAILNGESPVEILGETVKVGAQILAIGGFSGHADRNTLLEWVKHFESIREKIVIIHGEPDATARMEQEINDLKICPVIVPKLTDILEL